MTEAEMTIQLLERIGDREGSRYYKDRDRWFVYAISPNRDIPLKSGQFAWVVVSRFDDDNEMFVWPYGADPINGFELLERIAAESEYIAAKLAEPL